MTVSDGEPRTGSRDKVGDGQRSVQLRPRMLSGRSSSDCSGGCARGRGAWPTAMFLSILSHFTPPKSYDRTKHRWKITSWFPDGLKVREA